MENLDTRGIIGYLEPALTTSEDRDLGEEWVKKLFGAEYYVEILRDKRNRYLAALAINMINDRMIGVFGTPPPEGPLPDIKNLEVVEATKAEWETDNTWSEFFFSMPEEVDQVIRSIIIFTENQKLMFFFL